MKSKIVVADRTGHGYYGVEIELYDRCDCPKDVKILAGKPYSEDDLIWADTNYTYRTGSCVGEKVCCKHCGKVIGKAVKDATLQIGVTRSGLGNNDDYIQLQEFLNTEMHKQHAQKDNAIITFIKRIQKHFRSANP